MTAFWRSSSRAFCQSAGSAKARSSCWIRLFQHCVVCFSHIYAQELPERRIRDYDNLELKQFLDVAASFILTDDNGLLCDAYNTTELGEEDCTRLFLMDSTQFPAWLAERQNGVKSISDF